jgi:Fe-S-cluster-containing dehydrogenase component
MLFVGFVGVAIFCWILWNEKATKKKEKREAISKEEFCKELNKYGEGLIGIKVCPGGYTLLKLKKNMTEEEIKREKELIDFFTKNMLKNV